MKKQLFTFLLLSALGTICLRGQEAQKMMIGGVVQDFETRVPVHYVTVMIKELGLWSITDEKGRFSIAGVPQGSYALEAMLMGYETISLQLKVDRDIPNMVLRLKESNFRLPDVVVTAKEGGGLSSSSKIEKQALEHVQPASIRDVLQLLPGNITQNPTLNVANKLTIRDISGTNVANSFGTAVIVDGASLNNNTNMQISRAETITSDEYYKTNTGGVDVRQIPTDNIESIEIIRGVPSVEYGDMTSGAVVVKTRSGVSPWRVSFKADPSLKQIYAGKGFDLGNKRGVFNVDADYALSYKDLRTPVDAYDRVNVQFGYSNSVRSKLTFDAKLKASYSQSSTKSDPDILADELQLDRNMGLRLIINGRYTINKPWITNLEYFVSGDVAEQYSRDKHFNAPGRVAGSMALESGESTGFSTPFQYYSDLKIWGLPINAQAKISANLFGKYGKVTNKVLLGLEWSSQGNKGRGKEFDPYLPPSPGYNNALRDRSYKDIPFINRYTAFLEDKLKVPVGGTYWELQAGLRANGIVPNDQFYVDQLFSIEPRVNLRYNVLQKKSGFKNLAFRGGMGVNYKMPAMIHINPEPAYLDVPSFLYDDVDANGIYLSVFTTKRLDNEVRNPELKLQKSVNIDAAVEFDTDWVWGSVAYFHEEMTNGYGFTNSFLPYYYTRYGYVWQNGRPSEVNVPSGKIPEYRDGAVYVDGTPLPSIRDTTFIQYRTPVNGASQTKWGVEYTFDFPEIRPINTSVSINGAYMNIKSYNETSGMTKVSTQVNGRDYPYVGIYAGGDKNSTGSSSERFNANVRFITRVPAIGMVVTLTAQMIFMDKTVNICELDNNVLVYYYDDHGVRHSGPDVYKDRIYPKRVNPTHIMDMHGRITPFTQEMELDPAYDNLIGKVASTVYYLGSSYPVYGLMNLRVTKEIGTWAQISFYANNFLNFKQRVRNTINNQYVEKNTAIYFGAEVKLTF